MAGSRLRRLAQGGDAAAPAGETCELCAAPVAPEHRHVLDLHKRTLLCACRACSILFDREPAGGDHYRLIPERRWRLEDFDLPAALWDGLRIPVEMAFFFHSTPMDRVVAFYPGPMGATESMLDLGAWSELVERNPVLAEMKPDVEALLVNHARGAHDHLLVPVDACYALAGLIRAHWRGLTGGQEVWAEIGEFFADLRNRSKVVERDAVEVAV